MESGNYEKTENLINPRVEGVLKKFLEQTLWRSDKKPLKKYDFGYIDVSRPRHDDMESIANGNYQIENLRIVNNNQDQPEYHFYIGQTEFHITGPAAIDLTQLIEAENKE